MPFLTVIVALLSFFAGFFVLLGFFVGATVGLAVGSVLVPGAGVALVPGAGFVLVPGAGVALVPGAGVALVPGAGVDSVPGAGVDSAGAGANFRLSIVHCSPVKEKYAFFPSSTVAV